VDNLETGNQVVLLVNRAYFSPDLPESVSVKTAGFIAANPELSPAGPERTIEDPKEGRLSRAAGSNQRDPLPSAHIQVDALDGDLLTAKDFGDLLEAILVHEPRRVLSFA